MFALVETLRRFIERNPVWSYCALALMVLPMAALISFFYADTWERSSIELVLRQAEKSLSRRGREVVGNVRKEIGEVRKLAELLAHDVRVARLLQNPEKRLEKELDIYLRDFSSSLDLHRAFVLNRRGDCVVSNDYTNPKTLIGKNFSDREYFIQAIQGKPGTQFVVGRVSAVPGFHFSEPVMHDDEVVGVATVKVDLESFAVRISFPSGFVTDSNGVVVLADSPGLLMRALPNSTAMRMSKQEMQLRYQRDELQILPLERTMLGGVEVNLCGSRLQPALLQSFPLPQDGLVVYLYQELGGIADIADQFFERFALAMLGSYFSLMVFVSGGIYLLRDTYQRRELILLNDELMRQAQYDSLTGCYNRRKFDEALHTELLRIERNNQSLALALIDLDNFKLVNDKHGHAVGDSMLAHVAGVLRRELRGIDLLARLGGEEFVIILPGTNEEQAVASMKRLLVRMEATPLEHEGRLIVQTFSAGVTETTGGKDAQNLLHEADMALYAAKKCGRNRVVRASCVSNMLTITEIDNLACSDIE